MMSLSLAGDLTDSQGIIKQFQSGVEESEDGEGEAGTTHRHTDNQEQINQDFVFWNVV